MFDYNETTNRLFKDGALIGEIVGETLVLRVPLTTAQKRRVREYLINCGYAVEQVVVRKSEGGDGGAVRATVAGVPMPVMDPLKGDKTPEVVEWYRDYQPEEFVRRYKGRRTHLGVV